MIVAARCLPACMLPHLLCNKCLLHSYSGGGGFPFLSCLLIVPTYIHMYVPPPFCLINRFYVLCMHLSVTHINLQPLSQHVATQSVAIAAAVTCHCLQCCRHYFCNRLASFFYCYSSLPVPMICYPGCSSCNSLDLLISYFIFIFLILFFIYLFDFELPLCAHAAGPLHCVLSVYIFSLIHV